MPDLEHDFDSSWTCNYCGKTAESSTRREVCEERVRQEVDKIHNIEKSEPGEAANIQRHAARLLGVRIGNSDRLLHNCLTWLTKRGTVEINQFDGNGFSVSCHGAGKPTSGTSILHKSLTVAVCETVIHEMGESPE